jgi:hypothetical protein
VGDEAFLLKKYLLRHDPGVAALNDESKQIKNHRLLTACRVVENAVSILTHKFRLFYGRTQLTPENADKVVLVACVLHSYLRNGVSVDDCVIENTDAPSQFSYVTTFRRFVRSASEEAKRVRKTYLEYFENVGRQ